MGTEAAAVAAAGTDGAAAGSEPAGTGEGSLDGAAPWERGGEALAGARSLAA